MEFANTIDSMSSEIYRYLNFDQMPEYQNAADQVIIPMTEIGKAAA